MKFRIIWIDDSETWVRSVKGELKDAFEDNNFNPEIEIYQETKLARPSIDGSYVDLIIIDCNLPGGVSGDQFIQEIRMGRCFANVVFYSNDQDNLKKVVEDKHFVHVTHRDNIVETFGIVADQANRKYRHPAFMRGLLLSEFIDLENLMDDLVVQCFKKEGNYFRESIIDKGGENYSLGAKFKFIQRLIKDSKIEDDSLTATLDEIQFTQKQFSKNIMQRRNTLAHAYPKYEEGTGKIVLVSSFPDVDFNSDWFHETRDYIHDHKNKLRKLIDMNLHTTVNP